MRGAAYYLLGLVFLLLAKGKNALRGYASPKPFGSDEVLRCAEYDRNVVTHWLRSLEAYTGGSVGVAGKDVVELGPGSDLGVGLHLLAKGARSYVACDVNDLAGHAPDAVYEAVLDDLRRDDPATDTGSLLDALHNEGRGAGRLRYVVQKDFDLETALGEGVADIVFSQAAFEHFDDIDETVRQMSVVCRPGAVLVAEVDLKTHSRWIRDKDPNNIYRYSDGLYRLLSFRGSPNRLRPADYRATLERHGWTRVTMTPLTLLESTKTTGLYRRFRSQESQMDWLTFMLTAEKGPNH